MFNKSIKLYTFVFIIVFLGIFPHVGPIIFHEYWVDIMIEAMIFALFALGFDIVLGYSKMVSFGHAAFFGLGTYIGALTLIHLNDSFLMMLALAILMSTLFALFVSLFAIRSHGVYFAIITFAFAQVLYEIAIRLTDITGGYDGLFAIPTPTVMSTISIDGTLFYYIVLGILVGTYLGTRRIMNSPLGLAIKSIGENENRSRFVGYNVKYYKIFSFTLSGAYGGLAGSLFMVHQSYASPETLHWFLSGEIIIMTLFGGFGTLFGPMFGAGILIFMENVLIDYFTHWEIVLGIILALIVIYFPDGLVGTLSKYSIEDIKSYLR